MGGGASVPSSIHTDKVEWGYVPAYEAIARELGPAARVCEIGVYLGGSLQLWQRLFPKGLVVGVDHDGDAHWPDGTVRVVADQTDIALPLVLSRISGVYDLIIDDASHDGAKSRQTFELLWPLVTPGGYYVLEDWQVGFPDWTGVGPYQPGMLALAHSFLGLLEHSDGPAERIVYRYGQALIQRRRNGAS